MKTTFEKNIDKINHILQVDFNGSFAYKITENKTVHIEGGITFKNNNKDYFPIKFSVVSDQFWILNTNIKTLEGSPVVCGEFLINNNLFLQSFEDGPSVVDELHIENLPNLVDLSLFPKVIHEKVTILNCPKIDFDTLKKNNITFKFNINELTPLQIKQIVFNNIIIDFDNDYSQKTELVTALQKWNSSHNLFEFINFAQQNTFLKDVFNDEYAIKNTDLSL